MKMDMALMKGSGDLISTDCQLCTGRIPDNPAIICRFLGIRSVPVTFCCFPNKEKK